MTAGVSDGDGVEVLLRAEVLDEVVGVQVLETCCGGGVLVAEDPVAQEGNGDGPVAAAGQLSESQNHGGAVRLV